MKFVRFSLAPLAVFFAFTANAADKFETQMSSISYEGARLCFMTEILKYAKLHFVENREVLLSHDFGTIDELVEKDRSSVDITLNGSIYTYTKVQSRNVSKITPVKIEATFQIVHHEVEGKNEYGTFCKMGVGVPYYGGYGMSSTVYADLTVTTKDGKTLMIRPEIKHAD